MRPTVEGPYRREEAAAVVAQLSAELAAATAEGKLERADNISRQMQVLLKRFDASLAAAAAVASRLPRSGRLSVR